MKLLSFTSKEQDNEPRIGTVIGEEILDLQAGYQLLLQSKQESITSMSIEEVFPADPDRFFSIGNAVIEKAKAVYTFIKDNPKRYPFLYDREDIRVGLPITAPSKVICVGRNYAEHATEMNSELPDYPVLFAKYANALIGPEDQIEKSPDTYQLDYEVELTIVIGKNASNIKQADAYDYIAGYTIGNDITARDFQKRTPQWLQGKTLDNSTPLGPWIVTADDILEPDNLSIRSYVNGEKRQGSNTSMFIFDIPFMIEFISGLITLKPGDIILTGTPDGVGVAMDPPQFLEEGDIVTSEIDGIGKLENKVVAKKTVYEQTKK